MAPEVMQTLIGRLPTSAHPALLCGPGPFRRHPVRNHVFPGLVRAASVAEADSGGGREQQQQQQRVRGILYCDLSDDEMRRLDWFEGDEYDKIACEVELLDGDGSDQTTTRTVVSTQVYLWSDSVAELDLSRPWSYETFRENDLAAYLEQTVRPCRRELDRIMGQPGDGR